MHLNTSVFSLGTRAERWSDRLDPCPSGCRGLNCSRTVAGQNQNLQVSWFSNVTGHNISLHSGPEVDILLIPLDHLFCNMTTRDLFMTAKFFIKRKSGAVSIKYFRKFLTYFLMPRKAVIFLFDKGCPRRVR